VQAVATSDRVGAEEFKIHKTEVKKSEDLVSQGLVFNRNQVLNEYLMGSATRPDN